MTPLEQWYFEIPIVTRTFLTAIFLTTIACQLDLLHPVQLMFSYDLVFRAGQYWRLITTFLYFGSFNLDFLFHMFFTIRYSRMLEENSFRGRTADYLYLLFVSATAITILTPLTTTRSTTIPFLSSPLTFSLVYLWSRRNSGVRMNFLGVFTFNAPYLPWVLLGFTLVLHGVWPTADLLGMAVGHTYYFLDDVWPRGGEGRARLLRCPRVLREFIEWMVGEGDVVVPRIDDEVRGLNRGGNGVGAAGNVGEVQDLFGFAGFGDGAREQPQPQQQEQQAQAQRQTTADLHASSSSSSSSSAAANTVKGSSFGGWLGVDSKSNDCGVEDTGVKLGASSSSSSSSSSSKTDEPTAEELRLRRLAALTGGASKTE